MTHKLRTYPAALPLHYDERLTFNSASTAEVGRVVRNVLDLPEVKNEGALLALPYIIAAASRGHYSGTPIHFYANARKYVGLPNLYGAQATYAHTQNSINPLAELKLVEVKKGTRYGHVRGSGQSTFQGNDALCNVFAEFGQEYVKNAVIRMREANGAFSPPPGGQDLVRHRGVVDALNASVAKLKLNFASCGLIRGEVLHTSGAAILQKPVYLFRTFEGEYDRGGLIGCPTYQAINKGDRKKILMDDSEVREIELKNLLAFQFYYRAGQKLIGDPLYLEGFDDALVAVALEACFDAPDLRAATAIVKSKSYLDDVEATAFLISLMTKHDALRDYFYTEVGPELRNKESNMMIDIASTLFTAGIGCLPLRNSVIVPKAHESLAKDLILQCFDRAFPSAKIELSTD